MSLKGMSSVPQAQCDWNQSTSSATDFIKNKPSIPASQVNADWASASGASQVLNKPAGRSQSSVSRSIVITTSSTGFQVSATQDAMVSYNVGVSTTATIGGATSGTVFLEIAATNSTTPSDWKEIARFTNGQTITLAIVLQSIQIMAGQVCGFVPAGYYARIRSLNNSGTPSYTYNSGQEALL